MRPRWNFVKNISRFTLTNSGAIFSRMYRRANKYNGAGQPAHKINHYETDLARFQRTLADGRIGCFIRVGLGFNQLVTMAFNAQKYRYGGLVVEVTKIVAVSYYMGKYQCLVRGYGHNNTEPRKKYTVEAETNAKASRIALQMYNVDTNRNGTNG